MIPSGTLGFSTPQFPQFPQAPLLVAAWDGDRYGSDQDATVLHIVAIRPCIVDYAVLSALGK